MPEQVRSTSRLTGESPDCQSQSCPSSLHELARTCRIHGRVACVLAALGGGGA